jgi:hypothetical protein
MERELGLALLVPGPQAVKRKPGLKAKEERRKSFFWT